MTKPFPKRQILDCSKLKEFADNNFKFVKWQKVFQTDRKQCGGKGEIAQYKQFLLSQSVFLKGLYCRQVKTRACLEKG